MQKWSLWHDRNGNKFVNKTSAMAKMEEDRKKEKVVEEEKVTEEDRKKEKGVGEGEEKGTEKVEKKVEGEEKKMLKSISIPDKGSRNLLDNEDERESENSKLRRKSLRKKNFVKKENISGRKDRTGSADDEKDVKKVETDVKEAKTTLLEMKIETL